LQIQKNFPVSALAGFHVLSALTNIATAASHSLTEDEENQRVVASTIQANEQHHSDNDTLFF
jgi:hypothetical protein